MGSLNLGSSRKQSNLQCFLDAITPSVPSQSLRKTCFRGLNRLSVNKDKIEFFTLGDLWDCYDEWSAYGAGVPIILNSGESVMQYYVPYLSAMQIYTLKPSVMLRNAREETEIAEFESDSWSENSESETPSRSPSNNSSGTWDGSEDSNFDHESSWPVRDRLGSLYFQYFENCSPYGRTPLMAKVSEYFKDFPGLMSFKSADLSPASWMAVAWYPIYHIPNGRHVRELSACFLTYHTLSSTFQDAISEEINNEKDLGSSVEGVHGGKPKGEKGSGVIPLSPFGLATYKMHGNLWMNSETSDRETIISLFNAAASWLTQLGVDHNDFNYFISHFSV